MRSLFKLTLVVSLLVALMVTPALAKKKAPVERTVVDGVTLAEVKPGSQIQPYYPATARTINNFAEVIVSLQVLEDGKVGAVEVLDTSIENMGFERSAADTVKQWRFHPALKDGEPIETATLVRLTFAPPTLKAPEGFVYTETSPRNFAVAFLNNSMDSTWTKAFGGNSTAHDFDPREKYRAADLPDCQPDRRQPCTYDKRDMSQLNGGQSVEHLPHIVPPPGNSTQGKR